MYKFFFYIPVFSYKYASKTSIFFSVILVRTRQKPTVKPTPNSPESEKPNSAWCGFSNRKPTLIHIIPTSTDQAKEKVFSLSQSTRVRVVIIDKVQMSKIVSSQKSHSRLRNLSFSKT